MKTGIIYKYTSPSGKCYVGQTCYPEKRKKEHEYLARRGSPFAFHKAIRKYGIDNFEYEVIVGNVPEPLLNDLEVNIIHMEDAYSKGYNMVLGGETVRGLKKSKESIEKSRKAMLGRPSPKKGIPLSEEHKKKLSKTKKGKTLSEVHKNNISKALKGKKKSEEHSRNISKGQKGVKRQPLSDAHKNSIGKALIGKHAKKVVQLDMNCNLIAIYDSQRLAGDATGVKQPQISKACKDIRFSRGGFRWMHFEDYTKRTNNRKEAG